MVSPSEGPLRAELTGRARAAQWFAQLGRRMRGRATLVLLAIMVAVYIVEVLVVSVFHNPDLYYALFTLSAAHVADRPWTIVTNVFSHAVDNPFHILINGLVFYFFGPTLENIIGSRRFTYLFIGSGVVGSLVQVWLSAVPPFAGGGAYVLGASGGIMGLMGTLTILAPELTVLVFFVIPAPLWAVTAGFAVVDFAQSFSETGIASLAHLAGLAVGLGFGQYLYNRGLRARLYTQSSVGRYGGRVR